MISVVMFHNRDYSNVDVKRCIWIHSVYGQIKTPYFTLHYLYNKQEKNQLEEYNTPL